MNTAIEDLRRAITRNNQGFRDDFLHNILAEDIASYTVLVVGLSLIIFIFSIAFWAVLMYRYRSGKTIKTFGVIDIVLLIVFSIWSCIILYRPTHISFDEVSKVWLVFGGLNVIFGWLSITADKGEPYVKKEVPKKFEDESILDQVDF